MAIFEEEKRAVQAVWTLSADENQAEDRKRVKEQRE